MEEGKYRRWDVIVKVVGGLGILITFFWGTFIYYETKDHDFKKDFFSNQIKIYIESSEVASKISLATNLKASEIVNARQRFWELYYGSFNIITDSTVNSSMIDYGNILALLEKGEIKNIDTLQYYSLALSDACRESLGKSWDVPLLSRKGRYNHLYILK
ncbi:MAG: hypothetical protein NTZ27_01330 [Ignavibacteriales bacterium]|nr:hypothetical protein [Ignavibacteriales bacterium]